MRTRGPTEPISKTNKRLLVLHVIKANKGVVHRLTISNTRQPQQIFPAVFQPGLPADSPTGRPGPTGPMRPASSLFLALVAVLAQDQGHDQSIQCQRLTKNQHDQ